MTRYTISSLVATIQAIHISGKDGTYCAHRIALKYGLDMRRSMDIVFAMYALLNQDQE